MAASILEDGFAPSKEYFFGYCCSEGSFQRALHGLRVASSAGLINFRDSRIMLDLSMSSLDMRGELLLHVADDID